MATIDVTTPALPRRAFAELLGTGLLVAIVVGAGIAAERLSTDPGLRLLESSLATGLGLAVLILVLQPVSGAHLNPVVTLVDAVTGVPGRRLPDVVAYLVAQAAGAVGGCLLAVAMFGAAPATSPTERVTGGALLGEVVATAGLVLVIFLLARSGRTATIAPAVGAYLAAAYWFTSSTSFANPAVTLGRTLTDTFAGIAPASAAWFVAAQLVGASIGAALVVALTQDRLRPNS